MNRTAFVIAVAVLLAAVGPVRAQDQSPAKTPTTTRDISFTSHDGHMMLGRLTLPVTPGQHPVLVFVQNAEASTLDQRLRNARGELVPFFDLYRETLAPLNAGFFSYEGRGVHTDATQPRSMRLDAEAYNTSTLENKVRDVITAVELRRRQPGVDPSKIMLRGVSEGSLLAAEAATRMPEIRAIVLSGVIGSTLKDMLVFMAAGGTSCSTWGIGTPTTTARSPRRSTRRTRKAYGGNHCRV